MENHLRGGRFQALEKAVGYHFREEDLLRQALTHSSYANEQRINKIGHYERLEFLGDAVLELLSSEYLFETYPLMPEGRLTKLRASLVCEPSLAACAKAMGLDAYLLLGRGEEASGGRERHSILSDALEALIGAVYLDGGIEEARRFVHRRVLQDLEQRRLFQDSKTMLQEVVQKDWKAQIEYLPIWEEGPEHQKRFCVELRIDGQIYGRGEGKNKKAAQQQAAYTALLALRERGMGFDVFEEYRGGGI